MKTDQRCVQAAWHRAVDARLHDQALIGIMAFQAPSSFSEAPG